MQPSSNNSPLFIFLLRIYHTCLQVSEKQRLSNRFIRHLTRHMSAEEIVIYPLYEKHLGADGAKMAERARQGHTVMKNGIFPGRFT
jgi:hypothetical protein